MLIVSVIPEGPDLSAGRLDKIAHVCDSLLSAWLWVRASRAAHAPEREYRLRAWMYATSYGLLMELIQAMVPWRSAELGDVLADAAGAAIGVWVGRRIPRA